MNLAHVDLPGSLRDLESLIGLSATLKLVEHFGGRISLYVPHDIEPNHALAVAVGVVAARVLSKHYGGDCLRNIPRCVNGLRRIRNEYIYTLRDAGESPAKIAGMLSLTERQIWNILADRRDNDDNPQGGLF